MTESKHKKENAKEQTQAEHLPVEISTSWLEGKILIAMPHMLDPRFKGSVILICNHNQRGAMGLILNREAEYVSFKNLLKQVGVTTKADVERNIRIHFGGPVECARGFVLHSPEYKRKETIFIGNKAGLTATVDVLRDIAENNGPRKSLLALGYAGWTAGQLDKEMLENGWLHVDADQELIFDQNLESKWKKAIRKIGFSPEKLASSHGRA